MRLKIRSIYLILLLSALSCGQTHQKQQETKSIKKESRFKNLLSKYKDKSFDMLHVSSPEELNGEYKGVQLDSADAILFSEDIAQQHFNDPPGLFSVYKIQ